MVQTKAEPLTLEEFLKLPETKPANEYINGKILQKPMRDGQHSAIRGGLISAINPAVKPQKMARAFIELRCTFGGGSIVPDVSVFAWERILRDEKGEIANFFAIAPDWTIEILSPEQTQAKVTRNILHCLNHGTQLGWLIEPEEQMVFVYFPKQQPEVFDEPETQLPVPSFASELRLTVGELFGWLME